MIVLNELPNTLSTQRIAIIGDVPGPEDDRRGKPFQGYAGTFLSTLLSRAGLNRANCFVGNVCQYKPRINDISTLSWDGPEIQNGLTQLRHDITQYKPNLIILLGNLPLKAALDPSSSHPLVGKAFRNHIGDWRGTLFVCENSESPFFGYKCISTYHPSYTLRDYATAPVAQLDIKRAAKESTTPTLVLPERERFVPTPRDAHIIISRLATIRESKQIIAIDIEGYVDAMWCIGFATSASESFVIPFTNSQEGNFWSAEDEYAIWRALDEVLEDPLVPKVLQNSLYDRFVLQYSYGIVVRGVRDDIMLKHWELYCELEKSLAFQASIYTREPFYKADRKSTSLETRLRYCCTDCLVTYEINDVLETQLRAIPLSYEHYRFNMDMLNPLLYMELRGMLYDTPRARARLASVEQQIYSAQSQLDEIAGLGIPSSITSQELVQKIKVLTRKKYHDSVSLASLTNPAYFLADSKKRQDLRAARVHQILSTSMHADGVYHFTPDQRGELAILLFSTMNIKSDDWKTFLYSKLKLPIQTGPDGQLTTDYEALLHIYKKTQHPAVKLGMEIADLRTHAQMLRIHADSDGRIRCGYNLVGTETARLSCYTSPTGSGYNLQTIPKKDRDLFLADYGYSFFQCDLAGADGWTVAARLATLGDRTMLDDYLAGLKPARNLCYMLRHGARSLDGKDRPELRILGKEVLGEDWDYFACKQGQHGTCYGMAAKTLSDRIFIMSEGAVYVPPTITIAIREQCQKEGKPLPPTTEDLQKLFKHRYHVAIWHNWIASTFRIGPVMLTACGQRRVFFGRASEIITQAYAHEPQVNTTYFTNRAALNLWMDPENRRPDGGLHIEPLHQVHDALCGQFPKDREVWARERIKTYFNNQLTIGTIPVVIPFEGHHGPSWGEQPHDI